MANDTGRLRLFIQLAEKAARGLQVGRFKSLGKLPIKANKHVLVIKDTAVLSPQAWKLDGCVPGRGLGALP
jgi:hypothetical protein